jgi:Lon protease-like protein
MTVTPMFPLGTVLLPNGLISVQIFEPRYRRLLADVQADDGTFGIVLIERGHEVGGGDSRFDVGTIAHIARHDPLDDGRHDLLLHGTERVRILEWLDEHPYPRAHVTPWPEQIDDDPVAVGAAYGACIAKLRRFLALATELGHPVSPVTFDAPDDPVVGSYLLSAYAPILPIDRQRTLECPGPGARIELMGELIDGLFEMFRVE